MRHANSTERNSKSQNSDSPAKLGRRRRAKQLAILHRIEMLEARVLFTDVGTSTLVDLGSISEADPALLSAPYSPTSLTTAYGINQISFNGTAGNGSGETIAIVDAYNDPNIIADANAFDTQFGVKAFGGTGGPTLTVLNQSGQSTALPANSAPGGWDLEESLDVEWAHSVAPNANIILFEANDNSLNNLLTAVSTASHFAGVSVVSMSWAAPDFSGEQSFDTNFVTPAGHQGVTFLASSGDTGAVVQYPSASPDVVSVGGTSLSINTNGTYASESAWTGGGGGISQFETQPTFQNGVVSGLSTTERTTPDVSMDADPNTGVPVLDTFFSSSYQQVGGTSLSTPLWAALIAIVDQGRAILGHTTLDGATQTLPALYSLSPSYFHDVTTGNDGNPTLPGYDLDTGLGSPIANLLVPALAGFNPGPHLTFAAALPTNAVAGASLGSIAVDILDGSGNLETTNNSTVTLSLGGGPSGGVLGGTVSVQAQNGVATFSNVDLTTTGQYTLIASDGTLFEARSSVVNITPGTASKLAFTQPLSTGEQGVALLPLTVAVEDQFGNVVTSNTSSVTISIATETTGGTLSGILTSTAANGLAQFNDLVLSASGTYTLQAKDGTLGVGTSSSFFVTGPAFKLVFNQEPTTTPVGGVITPSMTVDVEDSAGNIVVPDSSTVTLSLGTNPTGAALNGTLSVSAVNGVATFIIPWLSEAGTYTLVAKDGTLQSATSTSFTVTGYNYALQELGAFNNTNGAAPFTEPVFDSNGNLFTTGESDGSQDSGTIVEIAKGSNSITLLATFNPLVNGSEPMWMVIDSSGNLYGETIENGPLSGGTLFELTKGSNSITVLASFNSTSGIDPEGKIVMDSSGDIFGTALLGGTSSNGTVWEWVKNSSTITALASFNGTNGSRPQGGLSMDSSGNLYGATNYGGPGYTGAQFSGDGVLFEVVKGSGSITILATNFNSTTGEVPWTAPILDSNGNLFGSTEAFGGVYELVKGASSINIVASFATENSPGQLSIDSSGDLFGNTSPPIPEFTYVTGTIFEIRHGTTAMIPIATLSGVNGGDPVGGVTVDSSGNLFGTAVIGGTNSYVQAGPSNISLQGLGDIFELSVQPDPSTTQLRFGQQPPATAQTGTAFSQSVVVDLANLSGTTVTTDNSFVTLTVNSGPGTLSGIYSVQAVNGVATFSGLSLNLAGSYTLKATAGPISSSASSAINVMAPAPTTLVYAQQPTSITAGNTISPAVKIDIKDQFGNILTNDNSNVSLVVSTGPSSFGTVTVAAVNGVATFSNLSLTKAGTNYQLSASDSTDSLSGFTSGTFSVNAATATQLAWGQQPTNVVSGNEFSPNPTVQVEDQFGNVVTTSTGGVNITSTGTFAGQNQYSIVNGVATVNDLSAVFAGTYTLTATDSPLAPATSSSFMVTAGVAARLLFVQQPPTSVVAGVAMSPAVTVWVTDQDDNLVTTDTSAVTVSLSNNSSTPLFGTLTENAVNGVATFSNLSLTSGNLNYQFTAKDGTLAVAQSNTFGVTPAAPSQIRFSTEPAASTTAGVAFHAVLAISDQFGNLETGDSGSVSVSVLTGPGTVGGTTTVNASHGVATFSNLIIDSAGTNYSLSATDTTDSVPNATSTGFAIVPAVASKLVFTTPPAGGTFGSTFAPVVVTIEDQFGNTEKTDNSTVALTASDPTALGGTKSVSAINGVATFSSLSITKAETLTLTASDTTDSLSGFVSNSFTISQASASILLGNLSPTFNGSAQFATATTTPPGLTNSITYTQGSSPVASPTNAGTYNVSAVITDPNYTGSASGLLVIGKATPTISLTANNAAYNGQPDAATSDVTGVGGVDLGAATLTYYSGTTATGTPLSSAPVAVGTYTVQAVYSGTSNYNSVTKTKTYNITPAALPAYMTASNGAVYTWDPVGKSLSLTSGTITVIADPGTDEPNIVASGISSKVIFNPTSQSTTFFHIGGLTLSGGAVADVASLGAARTHNNHLVLVVGLYNGNAATPTTFSIETGHNSALDLEDNDLVVHNFSDLSYIQSLITDGRDLTDGSAEWNGPGIRSTTAFNIDDPNTGSQGYEDVALAADLNGNLENAGLGFTQWSVGNMSESLRADGNDILIKYTYVGDVDLNGQVDVNDYGVLINNIGTTSGAEWGLGDMDNSGAIDVNDYSILLNQLGSGTAGGANATGGANANVLL